VGVPGARIHQRRSCRLVVPVDLRLGQAGVVLANGVESSTRRTPTSPACLAAATVTAKIRSGRAEAASLARMSTRTVWLKLG
jgi:hypothetical protein